MTKNHIDVINPSNIESFFSYPILIPYDNVNLDNYIHSNIWYSTVLTLGFSISPLLDANLSFKIENKEFQIHYNSLSIELDYYKTIFSLMTKSK